MLRDLAKFIASNIRYDKDRDTYDFHEGAPEWMKNIWAKNPGGSYSEPHPNPKVNELVEALMGAFDSIRGGDKHTRGMTHDALEHIGDPYTSDPEEHEWQPDVYTKDLLDWMGSHHERKGRVDETLRDAFSEGTYDPDLGLDGAIMRAQSGEYDEVHHQTLQNLRDLAEDMSFDPDAHPDPSETFDHIGHTLRSDKVPSIDGIDWKNYAGDLYDPDDTHGAVFHALKRGHNTSREQHAVEKEDHFGHDFTHPDALGYTFRWGGGPAVNISDPFGKVNDVLGVKDDTGEVNSDHTPSLKQVKSAIDQAVKSGYHDRWFNAGIQKSRWKDEDPPKSIKDLADRYKVTPPDPSLRIRDVPQNQDPDDRIRAFLADPMNAGGVDGFGRANPSWLFPRGGIQRVIGDDTELADKLRGTLRSFAPRYDDGHGAAMEAFSQHLIDRPDHPGWGVISQWENAGVAPGVSKGRAPIPLGGPQKALPHSWHPKALKAFQDYKKSDPVLHGHLIDTIKAIKNDPTHGKMWSNAPVRTVRVGDGAHWRLIYATDPHVPDEHAAKINNVRIVHIGHKSETSNDPAGRIRFMAHSPTWVGEDEAKTGL